MAGASPRRIVLLPSAGSRLTFAVLPLVGFVVIAAGPTRAAEVLTPAPLPLAPPTALATGAARAQPVAATQLLLALQQ